MVFDEHGHIWIRQSWLSEFLDCPERARLKIVHPEADTTGDAAACGTAAHHGIEQVIRGKIDPEEIGIEARAEARRLIAEEPIEWKTFDTQAEMIEMAGKCAVAWKQDVYPNLPPGGLAEQEFAVPDILRVNGVPVGIRGTADYSLPGEIWDWKTSGRNYDQRKKQKSAIQPTIYALAAFKSGLGYDSSTYPNPIPFTYGVMVRLKKPRCQTLTVYRHEGHFEWAKHRIEGAVRMALEYGVDKPWPTNEESFLCSDKWCPFFDQCRGQFVTWRDDRAA